MASIPKAKPILAINLFGGFAVAREGKPISDFESDKVRALLAYLAYESNQAHSREFLAGLLWPEHPESRARRNLSNALYNINQTLCEREAPQRFLASTRTSIQFNISSAHWLDVAEFETLLSEANNHAHADALNCQCCFEWLEIAASLYRDEFLAGFSLSANNAFTEWQIVSRERLCRQATWALKTLVERLEGAGEVERALGHAWRWVELEPLSEAPQRELIRLLIQDGQTSRALAQFERFAQTLEEELDIQPDEKTRALIEQIREQAFALGRPPSPGCTAQAISFGKIVKEHRHSLGLTQVELARQVGCATVTLRKIEYDSLRPSEQIAELLATALDIPLEDEADFVRMARTASLITPPPSPLPALPPLPKEIGEKDLSGRAIRGYLLGERIGQGGFGIVYRAMQPGVERDVAIKIILPQYANSPEFIRRFEAEAQLVARLEHPHIVPLYDYWREPDAAYLVMRLLRGGNLNDLIKKSPLDVETLIRVLEQVSAALYAAHLLGVIHQDLKPANILLDEYDNAYLGDFGIAMYMRDSRLAELTQENAVIDTPAYISPEQIRAEPALPRADIYCLGVLIYEMLTGMPPFKGPTPKELIEQHLSAPFPSLGPYRPSLATTLDPVIQKATAKGPADRYADIPTFMNDIRGALGIEGYVVLDMEGVFVGEIPGVHEQMTAFDIAEIENPYKGLRPFDEADADDFFGRETLIQDMLGRLGEDGDISRFLAVMGPSGCGKSSAVKAGLIPALRRGALPGSENWFIADFKPGAHPLKELEAALLRVAVNSPENLLEQLGESEHGLLRVVRRILPVDKSIELVLVIDQFEELFTLVDDEAARVHFLESLLAAVLDPDNRLWVIVTLRADFADRPLQYVDFGDLVRQRTEFVMPLTPEELERTIVSPAQGAGLLFEQGLVARIIREVGDQPGSLPSLQYALTELFERREGRRLTLAAYEDSGGVLGALSRRAEEIYAGLDEAEQNAARQLFLRLVTFWHLSEHRSGSASTAHQPFLRLVTLGEGTEDVRRRTLLSELESILTIHSPLSTLLEAFGKYRLLTFDHDPVTRGPTVEVAHEALLREWPRLRVWLDESRDDIRMQRLLAAGTAEWIQAGKDPGFLLRGSRLDQFAEWGENTTLALTADESDYLEASLEARRAREEAEAERQAHEAALERRSRNFLRLLVGVFALAAVVALILSGVAFIQRRIAREQANLAIANSLALQADLQAGQPDLALLLSMEALDRLDSLQTRGSLLNAIQNNPIRVRFLQGHESFLFAVAVSPDGHMVASGGWEDKTIRLWDAVSGEPIGEPLISPSDIDTIGDLAFSPDGRILASGGCKEDEEDWCIQGIINFWDMTEGETFGQPIGEPPSIHSILDPLLAFSPDGAILASRGCLETTTGTAEGDCLNWSITLWDVAALLEDPSGDPGDSMIGRIFKNIAVINSIVFSPDGSILAVGECHTAERRVNQYQCVRSEISLYDVSDVAPLGEGERLPPDAGIGPLIWQVTPTDHLWYLGSMAFSPDGRVLATGGCGEEQIWDSLRLKETGCPSGEIAFWDVATGDLIGEPILGQPPVRSVAFSPDGKTLAAGHADASITLWDLNTGKRIGKPLTGHKDWVTEVAFSPDGGTLVSVSEDSRVGLWDMTTSGGIGSLFVQGPLPFGPSGYSPNGGILAAGSADGIYLWDTSTGQTLDYSPLAGQNIIWSIAYSRDGEMMATGSWDNTIRLWDLADGEPIGPVLLSKTPLARFF